MIVYLYLSIIAAVSIITGVIVTMIERKGFYPNVEKVVKEKQVVQQVEEEEEEEEESDFSQDPVITNAVTLMNMKPITSEEDVVSNQYDMPVLVSAYTVDLSDVVKEIQQQPKDDIEILDDTFIKTEGLV